MPARKTAFLLHFSQYMVNILLNLQDSFFLIPSFCENGSRISKKTQKPKFLPPNLRHLAEIQIFKD